METSEILQQLEKFTPGSFPRDAVAAAIARRDEITPELLRILEKTLEEDGAVDDDYIAHLYAMFLLAQFRETRAYPLLLRLALLPGDVLDSLWGDVVTEDLGRILASVCGGDVQGIQSLIENEDASEWARAAGLSCLTTLVVTGQRSREEILGYFGALFRGGLPRMWSHVWDSLVSFTSDLYPEELLEDIKRAYDDSLIDDRFIGWADVQSDLDAGKERTLARVTRQAQHKLVEDTIAEIGWWDCFQDHSHDRETAAAARAAAAAQAAVTITAGSEASAVSPVKYSAPRPGRNDPCPCGSGRKYKKCCARQ